jgi:hypothetical protein
MCIMAIYNKFAAVIRKLKSNLTRLETTLSLKSLLTKNRSLNKKRFINNIKLSKNFCKQIGGLRQFTCRNRLPAGMNFIQEFND